ncbi:MAG: hypothetical protein CMO68_00625 [Verrucomicrobiales bacterium]|nr:hypothetical protein [Verrucomicrobiales bacterium]
MAPSTQAPTATSAPVPVVITDFVFSPDPTEEPTEEPTADPTVEPTPGADAPTPTPGEATATPTAAPAVPTPTPTPTPTTSPIIIARPTRTPTPLPTATSAPPVAGAGLIIECIFFDGTANAAEPDEYVQILNQGTATVNLFRWRLSDVSDTAPELTFPSYDLNPGSIVRVYTNEEHPESGGFSFGRSSSVWNNNNPDTAGQYDAAGSLVFLKSYPPGC